MAAYLKRLVRGAAAYQFADVVAKVLALALLPVYTRHLSRADYGIAELLVTLVIFVSILVRVGIHESFVRYWFADEDPEARRALARRSVGFLLAATTAVALFGAIFAGPLSELILDRRDTGIMLAAVLGLWAFTNLELAYALLRVEEKWRAHTIASPLNLARTPPSPPLLLGAPHPGAPGPPAGNH